jgi:YggT family protein
MTSSVSFVVAILGWISIGLIVWIVLSYIVMFGRVSFDHPVRKLYEFLNRMVEPMLSPIRRVVPPVRMGGSSLDLSPLILIIGIQLLANVLRGFA